MSQEQNYQVNYTIAVEASKGTEEVKKFAESVGKLVSAKAKLTPAVENIKEMMTEIDKAFRHKGRKRDYSYNFNIDTHNTEEKLTRVKVLLGEIKEMCSGINLVINAGQKIDSRSVKSQTRNLVDKKTFDEQQEAAKKTAANSVKAVLDTQKHITKAIGKINAAVASLEKGREVNIKTDVAKQRLEELLVLLTRIKGASKMTFGIPTGAPGGIPYTPIVPYAPGSPNLSKEALGRMQEKLVTSKQLYEQKTAFNTQERNAKLKQQTEEAAIKRADWEAKRAIKLREELQRKNLANQLKIEREAAKRQEQLLAKARREEEAIRKKSLAEQKKHEQASAKQKKQNAAQVVKDTQRKVRIDNTIYSDKRRAAINRMQYTKRPSLNTLPLMGMFNGYMAYSFIKSELAKAVEYYNVMESARSILRVADGDLSTFETRFDKMARNVRQIGIETKFTALEIGGAVKYLAMAGMDIDTINKSMRPITNLALIGDNDVALIADLATNIMSGYSIKNTSMDSVADILSSAVSRANVNIVELSEAFKMCSGYLKTSGVEFSEAAAGIGILGNAGIKGTMAGTAMRAMSTRFAKPTKESQKTLDRLNVKFTSQEDVYGKQVEKLRPLADIFQELDQKGATIADMQSVFGKIGGNAAMMFIRNHAELRKLTSENKVSHGISSNLALVKQNTTKGLWAQVTSQLTESFMQSYESIEPILRGLLKDFLEKFKAPEFAKGITSIGKGLLEIASILAKIGIWFTNNFSWLEPLLFSGFVATKLFKLTGAITNFGYAIGLLGRQKVASSTLELISGLVGGKGGSVRTLPFATKRSIVSALSAAGVKGKGAMGRVVANSMGSGIGAAARGGFTGLLASQVATGGGVTGAAASLSAIGTGAVFATAGVASLVGALGWVAYKTWQIKKAKDAVQEEIRANTKYRYPSIEALHDSLKATYTQAIATKRAVDDATQGKSIEEVSGQKVGAFTGNWWAALLSSGAAGQHYGNYEPYSFNDAYQDDLRNAIKTIAQKDSQSLINSAYGEMGKLNSALEVRAFIQNIDEIYGYKEKNLDTSLWNVDRNGKVKYKKGLDKLTAAQAAQTIDYANYQNDFTLKDIRVAANAYLSAISSQDSAMNIMKASGFDFDLLKEKGFSLVDGFWAQRKLGKDASEKEREDQFAGKKSVHNLLVHQAAALRKTFGDSSEIAENILQKAGFKASLYSNEPDFQDKDPWNANGITSPKTYGDDWHAGGNYSGTGKLSSAAPKQVIVNISNLLSVQTIDLMKSPEGIQSEIQNLKEQLAQALIDTVHDFDASWNG